MSLPAARAMASALLQHADAFRWQRGATPLSDERLMLAVPAAFVAAVLLLRAALRGRTVPLGPLPALHNCVLMLWSLAMFSGTAAEAWRLSAAGAGAEWLFCLPPGTQVAGRLYWWSYVYYISKYYELLDTVLRVLKAQPLTFLHVFHHAVVLVMAYGWLEFAQSLQVVALLTNTGVHVMMYSYYLLCSLGQRPGRVFKLFVTNGQIVQFIFSFLCCVPFLYLHAARGCSGFQAWLFNAVFNVALLALFANFRRTAYAPTTAKPKRAKRA